MSRSEQVVALLDDIIQACSQGDAQQATGGRQAFFRQFLPAMRYLRALDPYVSLLFGDVGSGKTWLFQAMKYSEGRALLARIAESRGHIAFPVESSAWLVGFEPGGQSLPSPERMEEAYVLSRSDEELRWLWLGLLGYVLVQAGELKPASLPQEVLQALPHVPHEPGVLGSALRVDSTRAQLLEALADLDRRLLQEERYVFIAYDGLERIRPGRWDVTWRVSRALLQLWLTQARSWQRIRCKIFLRRDLYERAVVRDPDMSAIGWHPAELFWSESDIYRLLFKRLLNVSERMRQHLVGTGLREQEEGILGWVPAVLEERDFAAAVKRVFSEHMGPDPRRGLTLMWIPNYLKDSNKRFFPLPALRLAQEAARREKAEPKAEPPHLIHYTALRGSLEEASRARVEQLIHGEFPWIERVREVLPERGVRVPIHRKELIRALQIDWPAHGDRPPETDPEWLLDYLAELGVVSILTDGRVDVGDLYLKGLHLERQGGVSRPRA